MIKILLALLALAMIGTTASAASLPEVFRGKWCGEGHMMARCDGRDGLVITAKGFNQDEIVCDLVRLTPQRPSRRVSEYRVTFDCIVAADIKSRRRYYWMGFYEGDHRDLFMLRGNPSFTKVVAP